MPLPKYETSDAILKKTLAELKEAIPKLTVEEKEALEKTT